MIALALLISPANDALVMSSFLTAGVLMHDRLPDAVERCARAGDEPGPQMALSALYEGARGILLRLLCRAISPVAWVGTQKTERWFRQKPTFGLFTGNDLFFRGLAPKYRRPWWA